MFFLLQRFSILSTIESPGLFQSETAKDQDVESSCGGVPQSSHNLEISLCRGLEINSGRGSGSYG